MEAWAFIDHRMVRTSANDTNGLSIELTRYVLVQPCRAHPLTLVLVKMWGFEFAQAPHAAVSSKLSMISY